MLLNWQLIIPVNFQLINMYRLLRRGKYVRDEYPSERCTLVGSVFICVKFPA